MPKVTPTDAAGTGVQAVGLALRMLEMLAASPKPSRVTDLATQLGTSKNRVHRHLQTLAELGYVVRDDGRYALGMRLIHLGHAVSNHFDLVAVARPVLRQVRDSLDLTVVMSKVLADRVYIAEYVASSGPTSVVVNVGTQIELHSTAQGKVALAFGRTHILEEILETGLLARTRNTITKAKELKAEIAAVRARGWAGSFDEEIIGVHAIAVPVTDPHGDLVATLGVLGFPNTISNPPADTLIEALREGAAEISAAVFSSLAVKQPSA